MLCAATYKKMESVVILLEAGCPLSICCWEHLAHTGNEDVVNAFIRRMKSYYNGNPKHAICGTLVEGTSNLYSAFNLSVRNAELLFEAGFDDINSGTPLWLHSRHTTYSDKNMDLILWLIRNGANLEKCDPHYKTTPAQLLAEIYSYRIIASMEVDQDDGDLSVYNHHQSHQEPEHVKLFRRCITNKAKDECVCACSTNGCNVMASVMRACSKLTPTSKLRLDGMIKAIFNWVSLEIESEQHLHMDILRSLTFQRLGITHTCHDHGHGAHNFYPKGPLTQPEICDIQFIQQVDTKLLEDLLVEFEHEMSASSYSFWDFISHYWEERMKQLMEERSAPRVDEAERAREVGVLIHGHYGPELDIGLEDDDRLEFGSWEWFEREVANIMERA
jgi:hypothetical protein